MLIKLFATLLTLAGLSISAPAQTFVTNSSQIIQIPAVAFTLRSGSEFDGDANQGTLTNAKGKYYAAVPFTQHGQRVCSFNLVHRDNDVDSRIVARLMRKAIVIGGMPFDAPIEMAQANTGIAGATSGVAVRTDRSINQPVINLRRWFYFVELEFGSTLLEALGVQIEVHPTCN